MSKVCSGCYEPDTSTISFAAFEECERRHERRERRYIIAIIIAILLVFLSNAMWLLAWTQYDYSGEEIIVEQDATDGGNANYIGNNGDINNGVSEGNNP